MASIRVSTPSIRVLTKDDPYLAAAARTLSLSFSTDPLISWLYRPDAAPWGAQNAAHQRWQERRVAWAATSQLAAAAIFEGNGDENEKKHATDEGRACAGMVMLHPPKSHVWRCASWRRIWDALCLSALDVVDPVNDEACDPKRVRQLFASHDESVQQQTARPHRWYLEVIAVSPSAQGQGIGGALMKWALSQVGDVPCVLECTDAKTIPFYEHYGFRIAKVMHLKDLDDETRQVTLWQMVRDRQTEH